MLYISTRGCADAFTAHRTLLTDRAPDGGCFIPMRFPQLSTDEVCEILDEPMESIIAKILNIFFRVELTQWDVGFCSGRNSLRVIDLNPKIHFAELWHNPGSEMEYIVLGLFRRVFGEETDLQPSEWFRIVMKIAAVFGIYSELAKRNVIAFGDRFDFTVPADDFLYPIAILYASNMGLPVGNIVCNCVCNHEIWNLIHRGELPTAAIIDDENTCVERLLHLRIGAVNLEQREIRFEADDHQRLKDGLFCTVSGLERGMQTITSVFSSTEKLLTPNAALCIAGLGDYRARTGEIRSTLIIEERSPTLYPAEIQRATGIPAKKIGDYLKE